MVGGGQGAFIGAVHRIAAAIDQKIDLVAGAFSSTPEKSKASGKELLIADDRCYGTFEDMLIAEAALPADQRIDFISIVTPNHMHFPPAKMALEKGFHVLSDKPACFDLQQSKDLKGIIDATGKLYGLTHNYTGYPMVRQMKDMIRRGVLGTIQKVDLQYYQGWINPVIHKPEERAKVWRLDPKKGGLSCCIGDIGTHAFDMLEYVTGMEVKKLLADLNYLYEDNPLDLDGTVLIRMSEYCKGVIRASQIATAEENNFTVQIYGSEGSLKWRQENPNELVHLTEGLPMQVLKPGHDYLSDFSLDSSKIPPGHPEGIFDSMGNIYNGVAKALRNEVHDEGAFPTLHDGVRGMLFIEKVLDSNANGNTWVDL